MSNLLKPNVMKIGIPKEIKNNENRVGNRPLLE